MINRLGLRACLFAILPLSFACGDDTSVDGSGAASSNGGSDTGAAGPGGGGGDGGMGATGGAGAAGGDGGAGATGGSGGTGGDGGGGMSPVDGLVCEPLDLPSGDCADADVICVGPNGEFATIQEAADVATSGSLIFIAPGNYAGFEVDVSGEDADSPIVFLASPGVVIDSDGPSGDGIHLQNTSHVYLIGFDIESPTGRCISADGATTAAPMFGLLIGENTCRNAGTEGFYLSQVADSVVTRNEIEVTGVSGATSSHGVHLVNAGADGTDVRCNFITGSTTADSDGIHVNAKLTLDDGGIITGFFAYANVITGSANNGISLDGAQNTTLTTNVVYGNGSHAVRAYREEGAEGPRNLRLVANTLVATTGSAFKTSEDEGNHRAWNNIFFTEDPAGFSISVDTIDLDSEANVLTDRLSYDGELTTVDFAGWQGVGFDLASAIGTSATTFATPGSDFHLAAGSPAIDAGIGVFVGVDSPAQDLEGGLRPLGLDWDAGAYESAP